MNNQRVSIEELIDSLKNRLEKTVNLYKDLCNTFLRDGTKIQSYKTVIDAINKRINIIRSIALEKMHQFEERNKLQILISREFKAINLVEHLLVKQIAGKG